MPHSTLAILDQGIARAPFNRRVGSHRLLILVVLAGVAASGALTNVIAFRTMRTGIGPTNVGHAVDSVGRRAGEAADAPQSGSDEYVETLLRVLKRNRSTNGDQK
jgi:hypothetical protein